MMPPDNQDVIRAAYKLLQKERQRIKETEGNYFILSI